MSEGFLQLLKIEDYKYIPIKVIKGGFNELGVFIRQSVVVFVGQQSKEVMNCLRILEQRKTLSKKEEQILEK